MICKLPLASWPWPLGRAPNAKRKVEGQQSARGAKGLPVVIGGWIASSQPQRGQNVCTDSVLVEGICAPPDPPIYVGGALAAPLCISQAALAHETFVLSLCRIREKFRI